MSKKAEALAGTVEPKEIPPTTSIAEYSPTAAALADLAKRMGKVVYDVSTPKGLAAAKADRAEVRDLRVALEKKRVEIKAPALKRCQEIDTEAKRITAELLKYETPPDDAIKADERRVEAERQALIRREEQRVADITGRIADMRGAVNGALRARTSAEVARILADVQSQHIDAELYAEFKDTAALAKRESVAELERIRDEMVARETEAEQLRKDREEFERKRAAQEEADRVRRHAEERDRQRAAEIQQRILKLNGNQSLTASSSTTAIQMAIEELRTAAITEELFEGFLEIARATRDAGIVRLEGLYNASCEHQRAQDKLTVERETQRQEAERIARETRELEARQQAERDAQAERERLAEEGRREQARKELAEKERNYRPSFDEIVAFVAAQFAKSPEVVRTWICEPKAARKAA